MSRKRPCKLTTLLQYQFCWEILQFSATLVTPRGCNVHYNHKYKSVATNNKLTILLFFDLTSSKVMFSTEMAEFAVGKAVEAPTTLTGWLGYLHSWGWTSVNWLVSTIQLYSRLRSKKDCSVSGIWQLEMGRKHEQKL